MTTQFQQWLKFADEDAKREASAYRHHFPVEQIVYAYDGLPCMAEPPMEEVRIKIVCGCNQHFAYTYGEGEHR